MRFKILILLLFPLFAFSQQFADKNYYLIDSLALEELSSFDRHLIDSCLSIYHSETTDMSKIEIIDYLTGKCRNRNVWPKYNHWVYKTALERINNNNDSLFYLNKLASATNNLGYDYSNKGKAKEALDYYQQALELHKQLGNKTGEASSLNNIGAIFHGIGYEKKALYYCKKSLAIKVEIGNEKGIAMSLNNVGTIYKELGESKKALSYYKKALDIKNKNGGKKGIILKNIGHIYLSQHKLNDALSNYKKAIVLFNQTEDKKNLAETQKGVGEVYFQQGKLDSSEVYGKKSFELAKSIGLSSAIFESALLLSKIEENKNNFKRAYELFKLSIRMKDSTKNIEDQKFIIKQEAKYKYENQKALDNLENEKILALEVEKKEKQKIISYFFAFFLVLVGGFLVFIFNRLRITKKQKIEIEKQKETVEIAHKEITDSIKYAQRLQNAILPSSSEIDSVLKNNFILFKPKNVVSGDFYWLEHGLIDGKQTVLIAVADCTGHGVPGAMVSVACSNALHRTVNEFGVLTPSKILDKTREIVIATFAKSGKNIKDGMDIALCSISENKLIFFRSKQPFVDC